MAPSSQSTGPQEEEEVIALPEAEKDSDVLRRASVKRFLKGVVYYGTVEDIEQVKDSGERLYFIRYTDGDVEHLTADQVRELSYTADVGDEAQSWSGVLNKAELAECKAGFVHDASQVSVPYCRFAGSCWRPLCPYVHASSRTRARKWADLWAWIAANEGEADDAKHDKTVPSLLLQLDGVESKLRDEMSARFDRDRCENDRDRRDNDKNRCEDQVYRDDRDRRENDRDRRDNDKNRSDDRVCRDDRDRRENDRDRWDNDKNRSDDRDCRDGRDRRENDRDGRDNDNEKNRSDDAIAVTAGIVAKMTEIAGTMPKIAVAKPLLSYFVTPCNRKFVVACRGSMTSRCLCVEGTLSASKLKPAL